MTTVTITTSQSWTAPAGVTKANVTMYGGGGHGATGRLTYPGASGGAGGHHSIAVTFDATLVPGQSYTLVVGGPSEATTGFGQTANPGADETGYISGGVGGIGETGYSTGVSASAGTQSYYMGTPQYAGGAGGAGYGAGGGGGGGGLSGDAGWAVGSGGAGAQGIIIIEYTLPTAAISASTVSGSAPLPVSFIGTVGGSPTAYDWDFGDGSTHVGTQNSSHTFAVPGQFTVIFTVTNAYGYVSDTEVIRVYWKPSARVLILSAEPWRR